MSELIYNRIKENLVSLKMVNTLDILDNYLEHALKDKTGTLEILDHIFAQEAQSKKIKTANTRIQMAGFPFRKILDDFDFDFQASIDKDQIMDLATMRFVHNAGKCLIYKGFQCYQNLLHDGFLDTFRLTCIFLMPTKHTKPFRMYSLYVLGHSISLINGCNTYNFVLC